MVAGYFFSFSNFLLVACFKQSCCCGIYLFIIHRLRHFQARLFSVPESIFQTECMVLLTVHTHGPYYTNSGYLPCKRARTARSAIQIQWSITVWLTSRPNVSDQLTLLPVRAQTTQVGLRHKDHDWYTVDDVTVTHFCYGILLVKIFASYKSTAN